MPNETTSVATQFVDLVLKHGQWNQAKELSAEEVHVLFATVVAAGFDPKEVRPGGLVGNYRDQDGSPTGKTYPINSLCPFKVVNQEDGDYFFATGWLDCALRRVVYGATRKNEGRDRLIEAMCLEIERSVPLTPIPLTPEGDLLREYPPITLAFGLEHFVEHTRDGHDLGCCVGVHDFCNGWIDRHRATRMHDVLVCRKCHLRVPFPMHVKTYGELRHILASQCMQVPA